MPEPEPQPLQDRCMCNMYPAATCATECEIGRRWRLSHPDMRAPQRAPSKEA